jgi:hypothetical protein
VGPERKAQLGSPDETERMGQETDALLAASRRLLAEMERLVADAAKLAKKQTAYIESNKRKK